MTQQSKEDKLALAEELVEDAAGSSISEGEHTVDLNQAKRFLHAGGELEGQIFAERYKILEKLGEGGVGTVYKVQHLHLDTLHALKILQTKQIKDQDSIARFCHEAKVITRLQHPNIVRVKDFGVYEGCPFMIMDYVEGKPISALINNPEVTSETWISIFKQVLDALGHAHQKSIVHRDIKPGNILYRIDENGEPVVTVVDFGLAKDVDPNKNSEFKSPEGLTKTGDIFGTPMYMSPEQCTGHRIDARSDIYSLGCVMYYCLAGSPPFVTQSNFELVYKQINASPLPFQPNVRSKPKMAAFEAIVLKAMAKDTNARYQYAEQMVVDLLEAAKTNQSNFRTKLKLFRNRLKASDRVSVLRRAILQLLIVNAIVTSFFLYTLPDQMVSEMETMTKYAAILESLRTLHMENVIRAPANQRKNLKRMLVLTQGTHLEALARQHAKGVLHNIKMNETRKEAARFALQNLPLDVVIDEGDKLIMRRLDEWLQCSDKNITMSREALTIATRNYDSLRFKSGIYGYLSLYGAVSLLALLWFICMNIINQRTADRIARGDFPKDVT